MKCTQTYTVVLILASFATAAGAKGDSDNQHAWNFDTDAPGTLPAGWSLHQTNPTNAMATWQVMADPTAPSKPNVLALTETQNYDGTFNMAIADGTSYRDLDLSVRVKAVTGSEDQGGGPVWRFRDENNYYISRFNPLESNFRVYYVKNGRRRQLHSARIPTKPGSWYTLRVTMIGHHITAYLNGQKLLEATDDTFPDAGKVGLWTKADASTRFDDLRVRPLKRNDASPATQEQTLMLKKTIALPGVKGRIDHLTVDQPGNRLFLAALGNGTIEVIDLTAGRRIHSIDGLNEPQGILYLPESKRVIVACGGDGTVRSYDTLSYKQIARCDLGGDADNIRWNPSTHLLYVGFGHGALAGIQPENLTTQAQIKLPGHPESFQIDHATQRIYVNVPDARQIAVIDQTTNTLAKSWNITAAASNYPMALDETGSRLFSACRTPPRLLVFDTTSGKRLAATECVGDADDIFYDTKTKQIYVIGGEGFIDVFDGSNPAAYPRLAHVRTSPGARTGLFVPQQRLLYVAAPARDEQEAELRIYQRSH